MDDAESTFLAQLADRVLVFDGAMGTSIHALELPLSDYRGLENCSEILVETRPDAVERIHRGFLEVGCDAVETNTFGANRIVLAEFGLADRVYELNVAATRIARRAADSYSTPQRPRFVAGSIGPGTRLVSLRQTTYDTLVESYAEQARGLLDGGVDVILIETCQDILQAKAAIQAVRAAAERAGHRVPLMCQVTIETTGTLLVGTDIAAALTTLEAFPEVATIGLNCATGPFEMSEHIRYLAAHSMRHLSVMPNAGLPQLVAGRTVFPLTPAELARWLREFVVTDGVRVVGGCCGTTPAHLRAVVEALRGVKPAVRTVSHEPAASSLYQAVPYRQDNSFLIVGERCNTNGSKRFKELLLADDIEGLAQAAVEQVNEGSHVLDVCVDLVGRDGVPDMARVIDRLARDVTVPLMLDSTEPRVIEAGLKLAGGKCIINSVNLEDGEQRMAEVCRLARQHGAAVVALTIDDHPTEAMAKTAARKLEVATRIHHLLTGKYGIHEEDIFFDCLTFPVTTGNPADRRLALETLDGIAAIMQRFPRCQSLLGVSNVSFGLQPAARVVLNSAFLAEARTRGLTAAIVHASKILPQNQIGPERWQAALDLIYDRRKPDNPLERFLGLFAAGEQLGQKVKIENLPIEERLRQRIIDGRRPGLEQDLDLALKSYRPLDIINRFLLDGMKVVGELFGSGQMQLPFVLKSAEVMKAAVAHLEPHLEKEAGVSRGKIVLATVRGDVHDIGKNLVDIILTNNGYTVYNLGIKQPIANIVSAYREHQADAIGLSGLLVKSTLVMRDDLHVLNEQGITVPVILGGAALTRRYVENDLRAIYRGPLHYAGDAFDGLALMGQISRGEGEAPAEPVATNVSPAQDVAADPRAGLPSEPGARATGVAAGLRTGRPASRAPADRLETGPTDARGASALTYDHPVPAPPFWGSRVMERIALKAALAYLNEVMLFQVQWGFRKKGRSREEFKHYINGEVRPIYRELVARCEAEGILDCQAIYGYWPCNSSGNDLIIYQPPGAGSGVRGQGSGQQAEPPPGPRAAEPQTLNPEPDTLNPGPNALNPEPDTLNPEPDTLNPVCRFTFPRQSKPPRRCLSDFWRPASAGVPDVVAFSLVTAGRRVSAVAREWFARNEYQQYLFLHGLGVETAEALAEYIHRQVRTELGIADHDARDLHKLFQQGYQGSRYSFGYPACPNLDDQVALVKLLDAGRIGVTLSDEFQLDPEQSTSAIIAYHPAARYFNVR